MLKLGLCDQRAAVRQLRVEVAREKAERLKEAERAAVAMQERDERDAEVRKKCAVNTVPLVRRGVTNQTATHTQLAALTKRLADGQRVQDELLAEVKRLNSELADERNR